MSRTCDRLTREQLYRLMTQEAPVLTTEGVETTENPRLVTNDSDDAAKTARITPRGELNHMTHLCHDGISVLLKLKSSDRHGPRTGLSRDAITIMQKILVEVERPEYVEDLAIYIPDVAPITTREIHRDAECMIHTIATDGDLHGAVDRTIRTLSTFVVGAEHTTKHLGHLGQ